MGERVLTAFKWAIVASLLTAQPVIVLAVAIVGMALVLIANDLARD